VSAPVRSTHTGYLQRIVFGPQAVDDVAGLVRETGSRRVLVVASATTAASDAGRRLVERLGRAVAGVFGDAEPHVPTPVVERAVREARSAGIDGLVSFGGGSCVDLAKAIAWFLERETGMPGSSWVDRPTIAHVAVPTSYSAGELTPSFAMTDPSSRRTSAAGSPTTAPLAAVYDPVITLELPARGSAETGMSALARGVECACSPARTAEAEALALAAVRGVAVALPAVVDDPFDIEARSVMLRSSMLAARAAQNCAPGVQRALAQLLGGRTGMSDGLADAVILAHTLRYNAPAVPDEVARIGEALGDPEDPAGAVDRLRDRLGLPAALAECGVTIDDLDAVARMSGGHPGVAANPRPVTEDDARTVLAAAY
jgi:maleylacetate reductase